MFNTARLPSMFERVVIASGDSNRQVKALSDRVQERVKSSAPASTASKARRAASGCWWTWATWWCTSCPTVRTFYNLEEIWGGKPVRLKKAAPKKAKKRAKAPRRRRKR